MLFAAYDCLTLCNMAGGDKEEQADKSVAEERRDKARTVLDGWITDTEALISVESDKGAVETSLAQLNEAMEDYNVAYMDYVACIEDMDEKGQLRTQYEGVQQHLDNVRTNVGQYIYDLDNKNKKLEDEKSVSQVGSRVSVTSSVLRAKAAAKKAALLARSKRLEQKHQLDIQEQRLKMEREKLSLDTELAEVTAEEEAIIALDEGDDRGGQIKDKGTDNESEVTFKPKRDNVKQSDFASDKQLDICEQQRQLIDLMQAPKVEIPTFCGNPLKYYVFIRAFEENVEKNVKDSASRLSRLIQYCTGKALALLQGCAIMEPVEGYSTARQLIKDRFGSPFVIAQAWIDHVTSQGVIKPNDGPGLQEYADLLRTSLITLRAMNALAEINTQSSLLHIVSKLPSYLTGRWRKEVVRVKHRHERLPKFEDLVLFVEMAAEEANVPIFGNVGASKQAERSSSETHPKQRRPASYSTSTKTHGNGDKKCANCNGSHWIYECQGFKDLPREERFQLVKGKHLCFNCLRGGGHGSRDCKSDRRCNINNCGRKHSYLLHPHSSNISQPQAQQGATNGPQPASNGFIDSSCFNAAGEKTVALPIVAVKVHSPYGHKTVQTYALLDNGSSNSFCSQQLLDELGIVGQQETMSLTTLERADSTFVTRVASNLEVSDMTGSNYVKLPAVYARNSLPINPENLATPGDLSGWPHLAGVKLPLAESKEVKLLIGQDCPEALMPLDIIRGGRHEPWASRTRLGWSLNGPRSKVKAATRKVTSHFLTVQSDNALNDQVERFWKLESSGLFDDNVQMSVNDKGVISLWDKTTQKNDGHYVMDIPFKDSNVRLADNKQMALYRLKSLGKKLHKDSDLKDKYIEGINDLLEKGYATKVPEEDARRCDGKVWYLPHHPVVNPNKDKLRIVFDCAAKYGGYSLNDKVLQGPDLTNKLVGVLMRFRMRRVCVMADIEAMFYQCQVSRQHQDVLRFLWWSNGDIGQPIAEYRLLVHVFGGTWSPSAANYALHKTAADHGHDYSENTRKVLARDFYVDDLLTSLDTVSEATQLCSQLKSLLARGGFNLTKWISNDPKVLEDMPASDKSKKMQLSFDETLTERALGVYWNVAEDTLGYQMKVKDKPLTKRGVLSILSSVYDPLGLASPFVLRARQIVQELFRLKIGWDDIMPEMQQRQWADWMSDLPNMEEVRIPRCTKPQHFSNVVSRELHHFADASDHAYGTCSYLRQQDDQGQVDVSIIMAKSRLAPLKRMTIPRLELAAATLAVRQDGLIKAELNVTIDETHYWSDSMIVLKYIANDDKRYHTYVANRVEIIRSGSNPNQWHHVDTKSNPADYTSRGLSARQLNSKQWLHGPAFLSQPNTPWPQFNDTDLDASDPEVKTEKAVKAYMGKCDGPTPTEKLINAHSSWHKLRTSVGWILAIKKVLRKQGNPIKCLQAQDLEEAENEISKYVQKQAFPNEVKGIYNASSTSLQALQPRMINELLCVGGRLKNSPMPERFKCPVILPRDSKVSELIAQHEHQTTAHAGREHVLSEIRQKYWIIGARRVVRGVINKCVRCKKIAARPCKQQMADLPSDRVTPGDPAFSFIGLDYFGPFLIKRGRGTEKRYGCIFTCLTTRAIHIEIAHSLEADSFINCLNRFMARRGQPKLIRSDNGTNFVGAERELREEIQRWNDKKIQDTLNKSGIQWLFNPPLASHFGGVWERQIRSVRKILAGLTSTQVLTEESLSTLMCIAEGIVNNRPITTVSSDPMDLEPLTPNHLLILRPVSSPPGLFDSNDAYSKKKWRQVQYLADLFWKRWTKEYLPQLQSRSKWEKESRNLSSGDIVLIIDSALPRNDWLLGRVIETYKGGDGKVRSVRIKTKSSIMTRPISKVCLLEPVNVQVPKDMRVSYPSEE